MCVGIIGLGLTLAGGVIQGIGAANAANAQAAAYEARAKQAERQAILERERGAVEQDRFRKQAAQALAQNSANFAAIGIDPTSGAAATVIESSAQQADLDMQAIAFDATVRGQNEEFDATLNRFNAGRARAAAPLAFAAPVIGAGTSIFRQISSGATAF